MSRGKTRGAVPRPPVPAPEGNDFVITVTITVAWAVALLVTFVLRADIAPADRWWIWTCAAGLGLGLFGLFYVPRLKRSRSRAEERRRSRADQLSS